MKKIIKQNNEICLYSDEENSKISFNLSNQNFNTLEFINNLDETSLNFIESFSAFYLLGDNIPQKNEEIEINFSVDPIFMNWFRGLFDFWGITQPKIVYEKKKKSKITLSELNRNSNKDYLAFSGGKDSMFIAKTKNVVPIHIYGINNLHRERELEAVINLSKYTMNSPLIIPIKNTKKIIGNIAYQIRDALVYSIIASYGLKNQIENIYSGSYEEESWYSESKLGIQLINEILKEKGYGSKVNVIKKKTEEEVITELLKNPQILDYTSSCVISGEDYNFLRKKYIDEFNDPILNKDSCGLCGKCAQINLTKIVNDFENINYINSSRKNLVSYYNKRYQESKAFRELIEIGLLKKANKL